MRRWPRWIAGREAFPDRWARIGDTTCMARSHSPLPHSPLPAAGEVVGRHRVAGRLTTKGEKGAVIERETVCVIVSGLLIAPYSTASHARWGFGRPYNIRPHAPRRALRCRAGICDPPDQASCYRLCGDRNPACMADLCAPLRRIQNARFLHGLCTYGHSAPSVPAGFLEFDFPWSQSHADAFPRRCLPAIRSP